MDTETTSGSPVDAGGVTPTPDQSQAPTPIELRDDSLVKVPGSEKPTKYGEFYRGLQGQLTKASQRASELERKYAEAQARLEERERFIQHSRSPQAGQPNPTGDLLGKLRQLAYLSGEDAAAMVEAITGEVGRFGNEFQRRDAVIYGLYNQLKQMRDVVTNLQSQHVNTSFDGKISRWVGELGLPKEATEFAKELYLAYEGDDLDAEFPSILKNRWEQVVSLARQAERARVDQARKLPFVPGKGGQGVPSKPLTDKLAAGSPAEVADELWNAMQVSSE